MNSWLIIGVLTLYIALLFVCAFFGEKHASRLSTRGRMFLFSLTLGVYCSSWTFYGATGAAVREGVIFLPIYLGPLLFVWFGYDIWRRLGRVRQHHAISSIADFVAARYGKSGVLAYSCSYCDYPLPRVTAACDCVKYLGHYGAKLAYSYDDQQCVIAHQCACNFGHDFWYTADCKH